MIGCNHVDGAIKQPRPQGVLMLLAAHRGVHLQEWTHILHVSVDTEQVVRLRFGRKPQSARLGSPQHLNRLLGRGMHDVQLGTEILGQEHDMRDRFRLAQPGPR